MSRKKLHTVSEVIERIKQHNMSLSCAYRFVVVLWRDGYIDEKTFNRLIPLLGE